MFCLLRQNLQNMIKKVQSDQYSEHSSFAHSKKVYIEGENKGVLVPMREISQSASNLPDGGKEENAPIRVYDT